MLENRKNVSIPKVLTQYFNQYILGNLDNYKKKGFNIYLSDEEIIVIYDEKEYTINIVIKDNDYYWHLCPYKDEFFETKFSDKEKKFEMLLFAIEENVLIFERNGIY